MDDIIKRLHTIVHGRVQGVGFRYFVMESVRGLDITGWVRNRYDGTVEVMAEGSKSSLDQLLVMLKRGPRSSNVLKVKEDWSQATGEYSGFSVRRDG